jgi:hypothetical protein
MFHGVTRGVSHYGLAIYIKKYIMETQIFHHAKILLIFKKCSKSNQYPSRYKNSIINQSQVSTQAKISAFKSPHIKIDLLPRGQNPLSYYRSTLAISIE